MTRFHMFLSNLGKDELKLAKDVVSFIGEIKTLASSEQVQKIAAMFPEGTAIDNACITLCNDAIAAVEALNAATLQNKVNAITGIWTKLSADLVQINHGSMDKKHNLGYYLKCIAVVLEDLVNSL